MESLEIQDILFKGKRKDNGEWVFGAYVVMHHNDERTHLHHFIIPNNSNLSRGVKVEDILVEVIPETVGQYIGMNDIKGTLIFTDDIITDNSYTFVVKFGKCGGVQNNDNYGYMGYYLVGYDMATKKCMHFGLRNDICYFTDVKVIGNIHDKILSN